MPRKIGAITPLWNQELFLGPHFRMLSELDKHVAMFQPGPLGQYQEEHGIGEEPDRTFSLVRKLFPEVEIKYSKGHKEFSHRLYNEILPHVQDMDIVFRLDVDMLFTDKDWSQLLQYIRSTNFDVYRVNFTTNSPNYYITGDYDHGVMDALEEDPIAFNPKSPLIWSGRLDYPSDHQVTIEPDLYGGWGRWRMHHFRGWNKPKSTPEGWEKDKEDWVKQYGGWVSCPKEIRDKMSAWQTELKQY